MPATYQYLGHQLKQNAWFIGITWERMTSKVEANHLHLYPQFISVAQHFVPVSRSCHHCAKGKT